MSKTNRKCPECGGETWCDEVDIGVGIMYGPLSCSECHWVESSSPPDNGLFEIDEPKP